MVVDSKLRRFDRFPQNWDYAVTLPEVIQNVVSVDLSRAFLPNTQRTIHAFNNILQIQPQGGAAMDIVVPPGNYEPPLLLSQIQTQLQDAGIANASLTASTEDNSVTISADQPFSLPFGTGNRSHNSIHRYLGFSNVDVSDSTTATGYYAMQLPPPIYVTVLLREVPRSGCKRAFSMQAEIPTPYNTRPELEEELFTGLVPLDVDQQTYKFYQAPPNDVRHQEFAPKDFRELTISIRDDKGNPYDANAYDHTLVFEFVTEEAGRLPLMCPGNNRIPGPSPWGAMCDMRGA